MPTVHQLVPFLVPADAISGHTLRLRDALRIAGFDSEIYAEVVHPLLKHEAVTFADVVDELNPDVLIYHCSTGSALAEWLVAQKRSFIVSYHNITPARFFEPWDPVAATNMRRARYQLELLAPRARAALADSAYNAAELIDLGFRDVEVAPLLLGRVSDVEPDAAMADYLARGSGGVHWLFVGRIAPNKCQHDILGAFAVYRRLFDPDARLSVVGSSACTPYHDWLLRLIDELDLRGAATLVGGVSDAELAAIFRAADVFVCLSEHEGFCIPLVEAMQHDTPVVAANFAAVPDTVGSGGLVLPDKDVLTVATAVDSLLSHDSLQAQLVAAGWSRAEEVVAADASVYVAAARRVLAAG
jgi:glycosyltransferase involved in cell wall biosynthesis